MLLPVLSIFELLKTVILSIFRRIFSFSDSGQTKIAETATKKAQMTIQLITFIVTLLNKFKNFFLVFFEENGIFFPIFYEIVRKNDLVKFNVKTDTF